MQTTIKPVLSTYANDNGTLFCLVYKNRNVKKSLPIIMLAAFAKDSQPGKNQYGISEKYPES